jgi:SAM-dependent methyltransferase
VPWDKRLGFEGENPEYYGLDSEGKIHDVWNMVSIRQALQCLESFEKVIDRLYSTENPDYRGRQISKESVRHYLDHERFRFAEILSLLPDPLPGGGRLLDVGTAYGFMPAVLQQETAWKSEGLEMTENISVYCAFAQDREIPIHEGKLGASPLPFPDQSFSAILFSEVLEHLRISPQRVFRELYRLLKPKGFLIVTTPNFARLSNVLKMGVGKNPLEPFPDVDTENVTEYLTHIREYTMGELKSLVAQAGFRLLQSRYSRCMEQGRWHGLVTAWVPRWRGSLVILAQRPREL